MHTSEIDAYATELAAARLAALRALADIVNITDDPAEKRRAAAAILRLPNPKEPLASARGAAPSTGTYYDSPPAHHPSPDTLADPTAGMTLEETLAYAQQVLAEYNASRGPLDPNPTTDLAATSRADSPAARLAASAGHVPTG